MRGMQPNSAFGAPEEQVVAHPVGPIAGPPHDIAWDLLRALTAARLASDLLAVAGQHHQPLDVDIAAVVRALGVAVAQAAVAGERLIADSYSPGRRSGMPA